MGISELDGKPENARNTLRRFKDALKKARLPESLSFHEGTRHSNATFWAEHEPMTVLSSRLGHSKVSTTSDIYSHVRHNAQAEGRREDGVTDREKVGA